jgi:hypothetical protein
MTSNVNIDSLLGVESGGSTYSICAPTFCFFYKGTYQPHSVLMNERQLLLPTLPCLQGWQALPTGDTDKPRAGQDKQGLFRGIRRKHIKSEVSLLEAVP